MPRRRRPSSSERILARAAQCEALERRRLLTFTVTGTPGPDLIEVFHDGLYRAQVNGFSAGFSTDSDVSIFGLEGNDRISILNVASDTSITIQGGTGNDTVATGSGHLVVHLKGRIFVKEFAGEGNDLILIDDTVNNADTERRFTVGPSTLEGLTHRVFSGHLNATNGVHFDAATESTQFFSGNARDIVHVRDDMPQGVSMSLGGGNDEVIYGAISHVLPVLAPATLDGGAGFDDILIDDADGPIGAGRTYDSGATHVMEQALSGFENLTIKTRECESFEENEIIFREGFPVGDNITVVSPTDEDIVRIGTLSSPIDLDDADLIFTEEAGFTQLCDQDSNNTGAPFEIWDDNGKQRVDKGGFRGVFREGFQSADMVVHAGSTDDIFEVSGMPGRFELVVRGGAGNDTVLPANRNGHQTDIDAMFPFLGTSFRGYFAFDGEGGIDELNLDDSGDQIGEGDQNYYLGISGQNQYSNFTKGDSTPAQIGFGLVELREVDRINLLADADNNTIYFDAEGAVFTAHGGFGNDIFTNFDPHLNSGSLVDAAGGTLIGGPGNDSVTLDDTRDSLVDQYTFDAADGLSYRSGATTSTFFIDSQMENVSLDQNGAATSTFLRSKRPSLGLSFAGGGGDDTFIVGGGDIDASGFSVSTATLFGGTGNDEIVFDDRFDDHGPSDNDAFTFFPGQINKDGTTIAYGGFESQKLITSGVNTSGVAAPNKVRVNSINIPTKIEGSAGVRDNMIDINAGVNISLIAAPITLLFDDANVVVSVNDQSALAARQFQFSESQMSLPFVVNYSGVEELYVYAGASSDTLNVTGTPAGMNVFFNGGNGDEIMSLGSAGGALTDLAGRVFAVGGDGIDRLLFTNGAAGGFTDGVVTTGSFRANGGPNHLFQTLEVLNVTLNADGSNINVTSLSVSTGITGGGGDDLVTIGGGDLDVNILSNIFVFGAGGFDRVVIDDRNGTNQPGTPAEYTLDVFNGTAGPVDRFFPSPGSAGLFFIACLEVEQRQFDASNDANFINVIDSVYDLRINSNGGNDAIVVTDASSLVIINTGSGDDSLIVNDDSGTAVDPQLYVWIEQSDDINRLEVRAGGVLNVRPGAVLVKTANGPAGSFGFTLNGVIDVSGALLFRAASNAPSQAQLRTFLAAGYNSGAWNGESPLGAIDSYLASETVFLGDGAGYGLGSQTAITTIGPFTISPGDSLVRYALDGDTDLNGTVNIADFSRVATNFNGTNKVWTSGDFNYDGATNIADFAPLAANFNGSVASPVARPAGLVTGSAVFGRSLIRAIDEAI